MRIVSRASSVSRFAKTRQLERCVRGELASGPRRGYPGLRRALEGEAPPVVGKASRFYVRKVC